MIVINAKLPTTNIKIAKILSQLIQGFIYRYLPESEHIGYRHEKTGKIFKRTNFDFSLHGRNLRIRFTSHEPNFEEDVAMAVLKDGLNLGEIHFVDTTVSLEWHGIDGSEATIRGCVACAVMGLLGNKVYLEPQDSRHLEMMKNNALQRFETLMGREYEGEFELNLKWQNFKKPFRFYYGNNRAPTIAWQAIWDVRADNELINLMLNTGVGVGCMSVGTGFLEVVK